MIVHGIVRTLNLAVAGKLREACTAFPFVVPLSKAAFGVRREVGGGFVGEPQQDLVHAELEDQVVDLGKFAETA